MAKTANYDKACDVSIKGCISDGYFKPKYTNLSVPASIRKIIKDAKKVK